MTREDIEAFGKEHPAFTVIFKSGREEEVLSEEHFHFPPPGGRLLIFDKTGYDRVFRAF